MRTIDRLSTTTAFSRLRDVAGRVRRAMMRQRPAVRMAAILAPLLVVAAAGYWAAGTLAPAGARYLAGSQAFSSDDLIVIERELVAKGIAYRVDESKVLVEADQFDQAAAAIGKLNIGRHAISEIRDEPFSLRDVVETHEDRERRERLQEEKLIERIIDDLPGVRSSVVSIQRPRASFGRQPATGPSAFVYLEGDSDRRLPSQTVQRIVAILMSKQPGLSADAITMMDRNNSYLDSHDPAAGQQTREEELRQRIIERLSWIKGVQVWVVLAGHRGQAAAQGRGGRTSTADRREPIREGEAGNLASGEAPAIVVNGPAEATAEPPPADPTPGEADRIAGGQVFVNVPRSYYLTRTVPDHRDPTGDELKAAQARTRALVEELVHLVVPSSWGVLVDNFPDELPPPRSAATLPTGPEHRRIAADWGIVGVVAASVAVVMAMGSWIHAARRPSRSSATFPAGRTYRPDAPDEPGPSERVRELVRRDPEAAASVLQRWVTEGGRVS
ncbi:MAG: hypothetical protein ACYC61_33250 [Isosphaeraceae bacterium]